MKSRILAVALALTLWPSVTPALRAADAAPPADVRQELQQLVTKIKGKLNAGKKSEADLAEELKQFDALLAEHQAEKTDEVAQVLVMKAMLYVEVLGNPEKGMELIRQLKADFPETRQGKDADKTLAILQRQIEAERIQGELAIGKSFPDFAEKDLAGNPLSVSGYKGKFVLVDFWATWCGPCVSELPNVLAAYKKYHDKGFEIVGISLDQDQAKLAAFLKNQGMTWAQFFDGNGWENKLALKYGIMSIPATFLLDKEGTIIAKGQSLRGGGLEAELAKQLP